MFRFGSVGVVSNDDLSITTAKNVCRANPYFRPPRRRKASFQHDRAGPGESDDPPGKRARNVSKPLELPSPKRLIWPFAGMSSTTRNVGHPSNESSTD